MYSVLARTQASNVGGDPTNGGGEATLYSKGGEGGSASTFAVVCPGTGGEVRL